MGYTQVEDDWNNIFTWTSVLFQMFVRFHSFQLIPVKQNVLHNCILGLRQSGQRLQRHIYDSKMRREKVKIYGPTELTSAISDRIRSDTRHQMLRITAKGMSFSCWWEGVSDSSGAPWHLTGPNTCVTDLPTNQQRKGQPSHRGAF